MAISTYFHDSAGLDEANCQLQARARHYLQDLTALEMDWVCLGDDNMAPEVLAAGWAQGFSSIRPAPADATCVKAELGSIIVFGIICGNLFARVNPAWTD